MKDYEAPVLETLGSIEDLTLGGFDKLGSSTDYLTGATDLDGSIVPDP